MSVIIDIDHEANDLSEYSSTVTDGGNLSAEAGAALAGTNYGLQAYINDTNDIYGVANISAPSSQMRLRFYIDPNNLTMGNLDTTVLADVRLTTAPWSLAQLVLRYSSGYQLRLIAIDDSGTAFYTTPYAVTDDVHYVEALITRAANATSNDGSAEIWIDGTSRGTISNLDNYDIFALVYNVRFGATQIDSGTSGTLWLDQLVANDDGGEIGPHSEDGIVVNSTSSSGNNNNTASVSWSHTTHADDDFLIVFVSIFDTAEGDRPVTGVAFNTSEALAYVDHFDDATEHRVEIWRLIAPSADTTANIVVTLTGTCTDACAGAIGASGVDQTTPDDTETTNSGSSGDPTVTLGSAAEGSLRVAALIIAENAADKLTCDDTQVYIVDMGNDHGGGSYTLADTTLSWTYTEDDQNWGMVACSFAAAAGGAVNFSAVLAAVTTTPDTGVLAITRALDAILASVTTTPDVAVLGIVFELLATLASVTTTPDTVTLDKLVNFAATLATETTTPDVVALTVVREFVALMAAATTTPDTPTLAVVREMVAALAVATTTPDVVVLAVVREMAATLASVTTTPDTVILDKVVRFLAALAASTTTPDVVSLSVVRELAATLASVTTTPDTVAITLVLEMLATLAAQTTTPDTAILSLAGLVQFLASIDSATTTPDAVSLSVVREMAAVIASSTQTPEATLAVVRELTATLATVTTTPDSVVLGLTFEFLATIAASTSTPTVMLAITREFAASLASSTITADAAKLALLMEFAAAISAPTTTPDSAVLGLEYQLAATLASATVTPDDVVLNTGLVVALLILSAHGVHSRILGGQILNG